MDADTVMDEWEASPFDDGLDELARLRSRGFSGAVEAGTDWLFLSAGEPVAVVSSPNEAPQPGDADAFEGASGRAHEAPHPTAARLAPMLALEGEVRGEYFTDDTPLSTVHETLSDGGFSGYVELSRNVLSGDYYAVYDDGAAEYVGFIGSSNRLITDGEAESKAESEVGIYSVVAVDLPDVDLPDAAAPTSTRTGATTTTGTGATTADDGGGPETVDDADADTGLFDDSDDSMTEHDDGISAGGGPSDPEPAAGGHDAGTTGRVDGTTTGGPDLETTGDTGVETTDDPDETTAVPSLDPEESGRIGAAVDNESDDGTATVGTETETTPASEPATGTTDRGTATAAELETLRTELETLRRTQERLSERVSALESGGGTGAPTESGGGGRPSTGSSLSPAEALSRTTLFVREGTRGGPTLEDVHAGDADRRTLAANVRLELHTRFDEDGVTVDGEPFESFLTDTGAYAFVEWLATTLPFEIRSTDSEEPMQYIYDALPEVDRVFFDETVSVDGDQEVTFDVVVRNRMGDPLFVATLEEGPDPTSAGAIEPFITRASDLCADSDSLGGAFVVTESYFESDGLELAREATSKSLLSREKHRSFVSLTRKDGYHLCLVEAREDALYMTLPEL
ncbi:hypothetical protein BRC99_05265 [Halobacteriales archaeon QS_7_69_60]|nr:MAG: hypothetical protein BRC99_05265 [Halobacteriales archaeon QS_7_69_60]